MSRAAVKRGRGETSPGEDHAARHHLPLELQAREVESRGDRTSGAIGAVPHHLVATCRVHRLDEVAYDPPTRVVDPQGDVTLARDRVGDQGARVERVGNG